jgi:hypothetical protein
MRRCSESSEPDCQPLLELVQECDDIVVKMIRRPMSYASDRPQDFVVPTLAVRAFRLAISSIQLALSGYVDSVPNLDRTIFEIGIRLLDMSTDPIASSIAYLMQGAHEEISTMQVELEYRKQHALEAINLPTNLKHMRKYLENLQVLLRNRGIDPDVARKKHGKLNIREVCRKFDIEKAYLVNYAFSSSYIHEKNVATDAFYSETPGSRNFEMGPIPQAISYSIADSLLNLSLVLEIGCKILEDEGLINRSAGLVQSVQDRISDLGMADRPERQNKID